MKQLKVSKTRSKLWRPGSFRKTNTGIIFVIWKLTLKLFFLFKRLDVSDILQYVTPIFELFHTTRWWLLYYEMLHCNPLQGNYRVELLHREIPAVITGNEFTDYRVLKQPFKPCGMNCQFPVHITGTRTTISTLLKQGKKCNQNRRKLYSLQDRYRVELLHREIPVISTGNGFAV